MNKAKHRILSFALALAVLAMAVYLPGPVAVSAAPGSLGNANDGIDFDALEGSGIYFGTYRHRYGSGAGDVDDGPTPVLWRVMGEENGNIVTWSEYVLDTHAFDDRVSDGSNVYSGSPIQQFLDGGFLDAFSPAERDQGVMVPADVVTQEYVYKTETPTANRSTATGQQAYLPWGIAIQTSSWAHDVYVDAANTLNGALRIDGNYDAGTNIWRGNLGYWKNDAARSNPVKYWLRTPDADFPNVALLISDSRGTVGSDSVPLLLGVRPVFQFNPSSIIYASPVVDGGSRERGETPGDSRDYITTAGSGQNYKLTVVNNGIGRLSGAPANNTFIPIDPGQSSLWVNNLGLSGLDPDGDYTVNYKIVTNGEVKQYGAAGAKNITDLEIDVSALAGNYTVYVWLQKNNEIHSHEGTRPAYFNLTIQGGTPHYWIALDQAGTFAFDTVAAGYVQAQEKNVTITTRGSGTAQNLRARLEGPDADSFTVSAVNAQGIFTVAPKTGLAPGSYSATVTATADWIEPQSFDVTFEVTEGPSLAAGSLPDGVVNQPYTYDLSGDVAGGAPPYDFMLESGSLPLGLSLSPAGMVSGTPQQDGTFPFRMAVTDSAAPVPRTDNAAYTITIFPEGASAPPQVSITSLEVGEGESKFFTVSLGLGNEAATGATITSDNEAIATANPGRLTASGSVEVAGVSSGTATISIGYSGGRWDSHTDTVQVTVTDAQVQVDFDTQGGTPQPPPITVTVGGQYPALPTVSIDGYTFDGWYTASGSRIREGDPVTIGTNHTLHARWSGEGGTTPTPPPTTSSGGSSRSSSGGSSTPDSRVAKTRLPASAFSWDGDRTLTIDHERITSLGLLSVRWNDITLTRGTEFGAYEGSVIIRFSQDFIDSQTPGSYTVRVEFLNHYGETTITVGKAAAIPESGDNETYNPNTGGGPDGSDPGTSDNPNTGDNRGIGAALLLGVMSSVALVLFGWRAKRREG